MADDLSDPTLLRSSISGPLGVGRPDENCEQHTGASADLDRTDTNHPHSGPQGNFPTEAVSHAAPRFELGTQVCVCVLCKVGAEVNESEFPDTEVAYWKGTIGGALRGTRG